MCGDGKVRMGRRGVLGSKIGLFILREGEGEAAVAVGVAAKEVWSSLTRIIQHLNVM